MSKQGGGTNWLFWVAAIPILPAFLGLEFGKWWLRWTHELECEHSFDLPQWLFDGSMVLVGYPLAVAVFLTHFGIRVGVLIAIPIAEVFFYHWVLDGIQHFRF